MPTAMAVGRDPETAFQLTISGPSREFPPKELLSDLEFKEWLSSLKKRGYTVRVSDFAGRPWHINPEDGDQREQKAPDDVL